MAREKGANASVPFTDNAEIVLLRFGSKPRMGRGMTVFMDCDQAGTGEIFYIDPNDNRRSLKLFAIAAGNVLTVQDFDFKVPDVEVRFTPDTNPGTINTEGVFYGG